MYGTEVCKIINSIRKQTDISFSTHERVISRQIPFLFFSPHDAASRETCRQTQQRCTIFQLNLLRDNPSSMMCFFFVEMEFSESSDHLSEQRQLPADKCSLPLLTDLKPVFTSLFAKQIYLATTIIANIIKIKVSK